MSANAVPIPFAGSILGKNRHVCAFFTSADEEYGAMLPYMTDGLTQGERVFHTIDHGPRQDLISRLRSVGIDVDAAQRTRQLEIPTPQETYMRGGRFDPDTMLALVREVLDSSADLGFSLTRMSAHVDWVVANWSSANDWVEYETRLNQLLPSYDDPVICAYDCNTLGAGMALDVLRTHPVVIIGGLLQENPFFVQPDELLREIDGRRAREQAFA
ncbi:MAG: hypothetical protein QOH59_1503 [Gemmatimonadales bacterium]|nr:hypothetical protein [Gemmatimonadales bacterium]